MIHTALPSRVLVIQGITHTSTAHSGSFLILGNELPTAIIKMPEVEFCGSLLVDVCDQSIDHSSLSAKGPVLFPQRRADREWKTKEMFLYGGF